MHNGLRLVVTAALIAGFLTGCNIHQDRAVRLEIAQCAPEPVAAWQIDAPTPAAAWDAVAPAPAVERTAEADSLIPNWLELGGQLSFPIGSDEPAEADTSPPDAFEPWRTRVGPAYPQDFWRSFGRDAKEFPALVWDDTVATFTDPWVLISLGLAGASGVAVHKSSDDCVEDHYRENRSQLSKFGDMIGDVGGNPGVHFAFAGAMYLTTLAREDVRNNEVSKAMLSALSINGLTTLALKGLLHTESPNDEKWGWPSGHTSSTFCLATVLHEAYGPWVGVPMYAFATFVAYERVDARNHDLSDVVSGAFIGVAIGYAVMKNHRPKILGFDLIPWADPNSGAVGLAFSRKF